MIAVAGEPGVRWGGGGQMEYDEEAELTRYVWDYCGHLMTEFEQRVG